MMSSYMQPIKLIPVYCYLFMNLYFTDSVSLLTWLILKEIERSINKKAISYLTVIEVTPGPYVYSRKFGFLYNKLHSQTIEAFHTCWYIYKLQNMTCLKTLFLLYKTVISTEQCLMTSTLKMLFLTEFLFSHL